MLVPVGDVPPDPVVVWGGFDVGFCPGRLGAGIPGRLNVGNDVGIMIVGNDVGRIGGGIDGFDVAVAVAVAVGVGVTGGFGVGVAGTGGFVTGGGGGGEVSGGSGGGGDVVAPVSEGSDVAGGGSTDAEPPSSRLCWTCCAT